MKDEKAAIKAAKKAKALAKDAARKEEAAKNNVSNTQKQKAAKEEAKVRPHRPNMMSSYCSLEFILSENWNLSYIHHQKRHSLLASATYVPGFCSLINTVCFISSRISI